MRSNTETALHGAEWRAWQKYQDGAKNWWTGATDLGVEGVWKWARSGEIVGDFVWGEGEPGTGIGWDCMLLHYSETYLGWDCPCTDTSRYPICQFQL